MKIYTKTGDKGSTRLFGGDAVSKTNVRVEAYGTMDELSSLLGFIIAEMRPIAELSDIAIECEDIQQHLFDCGSDLATPRELRPYKQEMTDVEWLEGRIDEYTPQLPKLEHFIIPGGSRISTLIHMARTLTRRFERRIVAVIEAGESVNEAGLKYVNRLSDYFFVVSIIINLRLGVQETVYRKISGVFKSGKKEDNKK